MRFQRISPSPEFSGATRSLVRSEKRGAPDVVTRNSFIPVVELVGSVGFEPTTNGL